MWTSTPQNCDLESLAFSKTLCKLKPVPLQNPKATMQSLKLSPCYRTLAVHVCCLVELIVLAVFQAKQVAILVSLWLDLCDFWVQVGQRWQRLLSAWSVTLVGLMLPLHCLWARIGLLGQFLSVRVWCVCVRQRQRHSCPLIGSQKARGPGRMEGRSQRWQTRANNTHK